MFHFFLVGSFLLAITSILFFFVGSLSYIAIMIIFTSFYSSSFDFFLVLVLFFFYFILSFLFSLFSYLFLILVSYDFRPLQTLRNAKFQMILFPKIHLRQILTIQLSTKRSGWHYRYSSFSFLFSSNFLFIKNEQKNIKK